MARVRSDCTWPAKSPHYARYFHTTVIGDYRLHSCHGVGATSPSSCPCWQCLLVAIKLTTNRAKRDIGENLEENRRA